MESIRDALEMTILQIEDRTILLWHVLVLPVALVASYLAAAWAIRLVAARLLARGANPDAVQLGKRAVYVLVISILGITALDVIRVPLTAFAFVSGAIAIGVGFGAQNIINNYISGWILMWERPIRIGDHLELDDVKGTVESIDTRSTRIRRTDGVSLTVPNSALLENTVVNWTLVDELVRTEVRVGVVYGSPVRRVAELIRQAIDGIGGILAEPEPLVLFEDFGDSSLDFAAVFWVRAKDERGLRHVRSELRYRIDELFADEGIVIAFPQRDLHVDGSLTVVAADARSTVSGDQ